MTDSASVVQCLLSRQGVMFNKMLIKRQTANVVKLSRLINIPMLVKASCNFPFYQLTMGDFCRS